MFRHKEKIKVNLGLSLQHHISTGEFLLVAAWPEPHYHCHQTLLSSTTRKTRGKGIFLAERFLPGENSEQISLIWWQIPTFPATAEGTQLGASASGFLSVLPHTSGGAGNESTQLPFRLRAVHAALAVTESRPASPLQSSRFTALLISFSFLSSNFSTSGAKALESRSYQL